MFSKNIKDNSFVHALLLILTVLLYFFGLWNAYFASTDDFVWTGIIMHKPTIVEALKGLENGVRFFNFAHIWIKTQLFGLNASFYFWSSLLQHIIVTLIVYKLVEIWSGRRFVAFFAALLFTTKYSNYEIVTGVSASDYSLWAIFYLATLGFFSVYLKKRKRVFYIGAITAYAILSFAHDFTLSIPLILLAYHLTLGLQSRSIRSVNWHDIKLHLPFWGLWAVHVTIQLSYVILGTSEAVYSAVAYEPGLHMISNLQYLIFLLIPNVLIPPIYNFVTAYLGTGLIEIIVLISVGLAIIGHIIAVVVFWKGTALVRFSLALIYLPFLQYTLWQGDYAAAPRYLYLPSIGISILLALLFVTVHQYLCRKNHNYRFLIPGVVIIFLLANLLVIQTWVQRHVENGKFRRPNVEQLARDFENIESNSQIYIEVPAEKFTDLEDSCFLVFQQPVQCHAFVTGELSPDKIITETSDTPIYWVQATDNGLILIYPDSLH